MMDPEVVPLIQSFLGRGEREASANELRACEEFTRVCVPIILDRVRRVHDPLDDLEDHVQSVYVLVFSKLPRFQYDPARGSVYSWVSAIAEGLARNRLRRRWRVRPQPLYAAAATISSELPLDLGLDSLLEHELFVTLVKKFAPKFPQRDARIIVMYWLDQCSLSDIASALELSPDTVWGVLRRVRPKLLAYLRCQLLSQPRDNSWWSEKILRIRAGEASVRTTKI
jgi:RNA polymerase sigma factor (sigma-70 family)